MVEMIKNIRRVIFKVLVNLLNSRGYIILDNIKLRDLMRRYYLSRLEEFGILRSKDILNNFLVSNNVTDIKAQFFQDLFVLIMLDFKDNGYFVEFGAYDGISSSNTYLLEKIGWSGVLAEPSKNFHKIKKYRTSIHFRLAVYHTSNLNIEFFEDGAKSSLADYANFDNSEIKTKRYNVLTSSLEDLLILSNAPNYIDYISLDTEGSEFDILNAFDFDKFEFGVITVEHNNDHENKEKIHSLLSASGYIRVLNGLTEVEDWYVNKNIYNLKKSLFNY